MKATLDLPEDLMRRAEAEAARTGATVEETIRRTLEMGLPRKAAGTIEWDRFAGTLTHGPDPLEFQDAIREEWS